jgi:2-keto-3-deoxy-L-rhamnonate aldolase RhmA
MKDILNALRNGEIVIGTVCDIEHPQVLEIIGYAGWDYVLINTEDSTTSPYGGSLDNLARAAYAAGITPMAKILLPDIGMVYKALNFGIKIIHASIKERGELEVLMKAVKYPPEGKRIAFPFLRATKFGAVPWNDYWRAENRSTTIVPLLETVEAMDNMEDILSVEGVELATLGPFDLAMNIGGVGAPDVAEKVDDYWRKFEAVCKVKGIHIMKPVADPSQLRETVERGCRCIIATADIQALFEYERKWVTGLKAEINRL